MVGLAGYRGRGHAPPADGTAKAAEEAPEVAGARGRRVTVVRPGPGPGASALAADQRGCRHGGGGQAVQLGGLPGAVPVLRPGLGVLLGHEEHRRLQARPGPGLLGRTRTWINTHTDQAITVGSL